MSRWGKQNSTDYFSLYNCKKSFQIVIISFYNILFSVILKLFAN
jgi:hypothetical protein